MSGILLQMHPSCQRPGGNCPGDGKPLIGLGKDVQGLSAILATLASLAGVFIYGRAQQRKEREAKQAKA